MNHMSPESFRTSWGSHISPYIQKQIIKRIGLGDHWEAIVASELRDILDDHPESFDEANEVFDHCQDLYYDSKENTKIQLTNQSI